MGADSFPFGEDVGSIHEPRVSPGDVLKELGFSHDLVFPFENVDPVEKVEKNPEFSEGAHRFGEKIFRKIEAGVLTEELCGAFQTPGPDRLLESQCRIIGDVGGIFIALKGKHPLNVESALYKLHGVQAAQ